MPFVLIHKRASHRLSLRRFWWDPLGRILGVTGGWSPFASLWTVTKGGRGISLSAKQLVV